MAERVTHLPRRCAATLLHLNTRSRTGPRFGASTQAQPGRGRGTHKLLSTPGAQRVSKPPPLQRERVRARCMGPARTLANAGGAGAGSRAARLTTWVTQVLCSAEPLTTTHGGSIVILSRENLRARTHHTHQPSSALNSVRCHRRRASKRASEPRPPVGSARPVAGRGSEQRAAAVFACRCVRTLLSYFGDLRGVPP